MKSIFKNSFFLIVCSFVFVLISEATSQSPCPSGYTQSFHTVTTSSGCKFVVEICYNCVPTHPGDLVVDLRKIRAHSDNPSCFPQPYYNEILDYVSSANFVFNYLCTWLTPVPCVSDSLTHTHVTFKNYFCWKETKEEEYYKGDTIVVDATEPCFKDIYCETVIKYCFKHGQVVAEVVDKFIKPENSEIPWKLCPVFYGSHNYGECFMRMNECIDW